MDIKEERSIAVNLRADLESKIKKIAPDSKNYDADKLSSKLESLNYKLTDEEKAASKKFLRLANIVIHSDDENYYMYNRNEMENNYETINNALDRIIKESYSHNEYSSERGEKIQYNNVGVNYFWSAYCLEYLSR